jgi:hypothetical protein
MKNLVLISFLSISLQGCAIFNPGGSTRVRPAESHSNRLIEESGGGQDIRSRFILRYYPPGYFEKKDIKKDPTLFKDPPNPKRQ